MTAWFKRFTGRVAVGLLAAVAIVTPAQAFPVLSTTPSGQRAAYDDQRRSIEMGRFKVTPSLGYALNYTDNVFYENHHTREDLYHQWTPGLRVDYDSSRPGVYANFGYIGDLAYYDDLDDNDWQRHGGFAGLGYETPGGLYLKLDERFVWSEDPFGSFNEYNQSNQFGLGAKTRRWSNAAKLTLGYRFGDRWFAEGTGRHYLLRYDHDADEWLDRTDTGYGAGLFYRLTPRTSLFGFYSRIDTVYDRQNDGVVDPGDPTIAGDAVAWTSTTSQDNHQNRYGVGVRVDPGGKLDGELRVGYGDMTVANTRDPLSRGYEDWGGLFVSALAYYRPTARTFLALNLQHAPMGSPDADAALFVNTLAELTLRQEITQRLSVGLAGRWSYDDYQDEVPGAEHKYFNAYRLAARLDWALRPWLSAGLEYAYETKTASHSDYAVSEYAVNSAALTIRINY